MRKLFLAIAIAALCAVQCAHGQGGPPIENVTRVLFYTKPIAPFSETVDGDPHGLTVDMVTRMLFNMGVTNPTINPNAPELEIVQLGDNDAIFTALEGHNGDDPTTLTLGGAAITITTERERDRNIDFLHSYFSSGQRVMARTKDSFNSVARDVVINSLTALGILIFVTLVVASLGAALAWFFESGWPRGHTPVFRKLAFLEMRKHPEEQLWLLKKVNDVVRQQAVLEMWYAFMWAGFALAGTKVGFPHSTGGRVVRSALKGFKALLTVVAIATFTNVIAVSTTLHTIDGYNELTGHTVCTVDGSTSESFMSLNDVGQRLLVATDIDEMFVYFLDDQCDAAVYDFPVLQSFMLEQERAGTDVSAALVGTVFHDEQYGLVVGDQSPWKEDLNVAQIDLINNNVLWEGLKQQYLGDLEDVEGGSRIKVPVALFVVPCFLGLICFIAGRIYLFRTYEKKLERHRKRFEKEKGFDVENHFRRVVRMERTRNTLLMNDDEILDALIGQITSIEKMTYYLAAHAMGKELNVDEAQKEEKAALMRMISHANVHFAHDVELGTPTAPPAQESDVSDSEDEYDFAPFSGMPPDWDGGLGTTADKTE